MKNENRQDTPKEEKKKEEERERGKNRKANATYYPVNRLSVVLVTRRAI